MSAVEEPPADENPNVNSIKNEADDQAKNVSDTETEPAMLDEEEMPSYVSLTSLPVLDENRAEQNVLQQSEPPAHSEERASSPYQSEQGAESVCVLSSGEESDRRPYGMMEDYDSEEMEAEEEEEEEEEEEDSINEEEESDGDIEPEQFERSSDDFVLRYDSGLEKHHKERSRSLQDLTNSRGNLSRFVGKRRSIDLMGSYESELSRQVVEPAEDPLSLRKKMPRSINYDHIPSKVKLYIQEMKEQRRRSAERMNRENPSQKNLNEANSRGDSAEVGRAATTQNPENKRIKSYVENAINEIKTKDRGVVAEARYTEHRTIDERGEEYSEINTIEEMETEKDIYDMATNQIPESLALTSENLCKKFKTNGVVECNEKMVELSKTKETNGEEQIATILNLRTLSYEEYTNGDENSEAVVENLSRPRVQTKSAVECTEKNAGSVFGEAEAQKLSSSSIKGENVSKEPRNTWNLRELTLDESSKRKVAQVDSEVYQKMLEENVNLKIELVEMKKTLEECRSESQPREVYERTLAENASLKRELEEIRSQLEEYRAKSVVRTETKMASVQTEMVEEKMEVTEAREKPTASMNKLLSSTATSAQSSMEQWSDSNCSAAISIDPPNIEAALNADDSLALGERTSLKPSHTLSHSFVTSSRILQTLANITQGRTKTGSTPGETLMNPTRKNAQTEPQGQSKRQTFHPIFATNEETQTSRAKKRKASDMLDGLHSHLETFKIPHTTGDTRKKINSDSATDTTYNATEQRATNNQPQLANNPDDNNPRRTAADLEDNNDPPETSHNIKYFVYHDEPDIKERSFLIQAEDSTKNTETIDKSGNARECGPFLLGNVEIRMSETNGTINIWGKELSNPTEETEVEADTEDPESQESPAFVPRRSFVCQSTPYTKCSNAHNLSCTSTKKSRISPKFSRSGIGKYFRSAATNLTRTVNNPANSSHFGLSVNSSLADNSRTKNCEHCESHEKRMKTASCEHLSNSRTKHSCCLHNPENNERDCDCVSYNEVFDESTMYETMSNILANHEKYANSLNNLIAQNVCTNVTAGEKCRHHTSPGPRPFGREHDFHQTNKRCSSCTDDLPSCGRRLSATHRQCRDNSCRSHSHISCEEDDHPLLFNESPSETPETKRRRLSGKKVRGILTDLLRGCSGCRDPNSTSSLPKTNLNNTVPRVNVTPCTPPVPSCSKRSNSSSSHPNHHRSNESVRERCCSSCGRPAEVRAQIESELEIFRSTMEQLLARSHALLEGLNSL